MDKNKDNMKCQINVLPERTPPSLVDLCINTVVENIRYLGDVGETDFHLLERILPHCTLDQLIHVEKSTEGRDLTPVTDELWKKFYVREFGAKSLDLVVERMRQKNVSFRWKQLYEAKLKDVHEAENKAVARLKQLYKKEDDRKQSRQVQLCSKVPPNNKRSFYGNGANYNVSNVKSNIMKKAKIEFMQSQEVKNLAAMRKNAVKRDYSTSAVTKPNGFTGRNSASTSKPVQRRF